MLHIYIDADSCPVKPEIYKVSGRYELNVTVVANSRMRTPDVKRIHLEVVGDGFDAADDWIVEHALVDDIVITADVLLASRCVKQGARVLSPSGKKFTEDNIGTTVASRDLLAELREAGEITGGPPPMTDKDRSRFLNILDSVIQSIRHQQS